MIVLKEGRNYIQLRLEGFTTKIGTVKNIVYLSKMLEVYEEETYKDWDFYFNIFGEIYYNKEKLEYDFLTKDPEEISLYTTFLNEKFLKNKTIQEALKDVKRGYFYATESNGYRDIITEQFGDTAINKLELIFKEGEQLKEELKKNKLLNKKLKEKLETLEKSKKVGKYKKSLHLTEQSLKYNYKDIQPGLFDSLEIKTKDKIELIGEIEKSQLVEGIKLSTSESKVIDSLCKILHENSQNLDPKKPGYYLGNEGFEIVSYGGEDSKAPKLAFTLYEITKEYKGGDAVGGKDVETVKQIINDLSNKTFLLSYIETRKGKEANGREIKIENKIEEFSPLIKILKISQTKSSGDIELSKVEDIVIMLNPIFNRHIDSRFITVPNDITKRTIVAYGSHKLSEITIKLRDLLLKEKSYKHNSYTIGLDKLYYLLAEKYMRESRKTKVKVDTEKALETVIAMGLLEKYEIVTGATGEPKIIFTLNKKWE